MCILVLKGILENLLRMGLIRLSHIFNVNFLGGCIWSTLDVYRRLGLGIWLCQSLVWIVVRQTHNTKQRRNIIL